MSLHHIETELATLTARLEGMERGSGFGKYDPSDQIMEELSNFNRRIRAFSERIEALAEKIEATERKIEHLERTLERMAEHILMVEDTN